VFDEYELGEAVDRWRLSETDQHRNRVELISLLILALEKYNLTDLSEMTGIKRTTLYYMIYGKDGKRLWVTSSEQ
jgi:hypothetical protein